MDSVTGFRINFLSRKRREEKFFRNDDIQGEKKNPIPENRNGVVFLACRGKDLRHVLLLGCGKGCARFLCVQLVGGRVAAGSDLA